MFRFIGFNFLHFGFGFGFIVMADGRFPNGNKRITGRKPGLDVWGSLLGKRGHFSGGGFGEEWRQIKVKIDVILVVGKLPAEFLNLKSIDKFQLGNLQDV